MAGIVVIGLGAMGLGMARNILKSGEAVHGFDIAEAARQRLDAAGGTSFSSAREAAEGCSLAVLMVVNGAQARTVLFEDGVAGALEAGSVVMLSATVAPTEVREIATGLSAFGHRLLDAPVSGGQVGAEAGTLTVMASGPPDAFDRAAKVFDAVAAKVYRLGDEPGMGATYKVVHQLAAGVHLAAAAELLALGTKAGCDPETLLEIVGKSAGASWMMGDRGPRMLQDDPAVRSAVDIFIKDLGLVLQTGRDSQVPLPLSAAAHQMFLAAASLGHGRNDDSMVVRAYEALTGKRVSIN